MPYVTFFPSTYQSGKKCRILIYYIETGKKSNFNYDSNVDIIKITLDKNICSKGDFGQAN